jgi:Outer membrane protein beta-barrel domain
MKSMLKAAFVFFILAISFSPITLRAQLSAGIKAGVNMSTLVVDDGDTDYGYAPGFQFGGFLEFSLPKISVQADVVYSQQGSSIDVNGEELKAVAKYVNVPVVIKYKIIPLVNIQVGPQFGFLTCMESDYHPVVSTPFKDQDYTKAYKKSDFGVNVGVGLDLPKGLLVDARFYLGLSDINDYEGIESTRNRMMQITIAYKLFRFGL